MPENQQQSSDQPKSPFSPLQTGCAFVMLSNMLIYLAVVAFTLNLLDASKIDASYLAQRGFTVRTKEERDEDRVLQRRRTEIARTQQQVVSPLTVVRREPSPAERLSTLPTRELASSRPDEPGRPQAARVPGSVQAGRTTLRTTGARRYSSRVFSLGTPWQTYYSPVGLQSGGIIAPERYDTLPVELASGFDIPRFELPSINPAAAYLYRPINPLPSPVRGAPRFSSPATGAEITTDPATDPAPDSQQSAKDPS
jgi:hypothetical protein